MKTRCKILAAFLVTASVLQASKAGAQQLELHTRELVMNVRNGTPHSRIAFTANADQPVWDRDGRLTEANEYTNPPDLVLQLDEDGKFDKGNQGWDIMSWKVQFPGDLPEPCLGRGYYIISPSDGEDEVPELAVDCYGTAQVMQDAVVTYDCSARVFLDDEGDTITYLNYYDGPEGLQPTPPLNFTCTNAGQSGQHPHFVWERPEAPEGVRCSHRTHHP